MLNFILNVDKEMQTGGEKYVVSMVCVARYPQFSRFRCPSDASRVTKRNFRGSRALPKPTL
jgi:hypothetical protein